MAVFAKLAIVALALTGACAQYDEDDRSSRYISSQAKPTPPPPVAILKQINRHNEDGSYTYGYEAGDGSFKIETKSPTGEVKGKYGYKDDTGKVRVVEYGANKYGFQPAGEGITVAPPTLVDESARDEDDRPIRKQQQSSRSQYRAPASPQQQSLDYDYEEPAPQPPRAAYRAPPPAQPAYRAPPAQNAFRAVQTAPKPRPLSIPGAAPAPLDRDSFFSPAPAQPAAPASRAPKQDLFQSFQQPQQPQIQYTQEYQPNPPQPRFTAAASGTQYQQQQQYQSQSQQYQPQSQQFRPQSQQPFSMLDQLLKEYALPQGGAAPLHDITFGTY